MCLSPNKLLRMEVYMIENAFVCLRFLQGAKINIEFKFVRFVWFLVHVGSYLALPYL